jgi:hypothetical protein
MGGRRAVLLAWVLGALTLAFACVGVVFTILDHSHLKTDEQLGNFTFLVPIGAFAVVGGLIAARIPDNSVGWICSAIALLLACVIGCDALGQWGTETGSLPDGVVEWLGWATSAWVPALGLMGTQLPLRLPDGRPLWRRYSRVCVVAVAVVTLTMFVQPFDATDNARGLSNPTGLSWAGSIGALFVLLPLSFLGAIASLFVRYRRAGAHERLQLRWIAFGGLAFLATYLCTLLVLIGFGVSDKSTLGQVVTTFTQMAYAAVPAAIGVAVLRHRLYDIDVVINRALVYGSLTAVLGATYLAIVLLLQLALQPLTKSSQLAVAVSTLAVAALFSPARRRIQSVVDQRFYRRKYDAARTLEEFSARLRSEIDLDSLSDELRRVVHDAMQPAHVSLWLRAKPGRAAAVSGDGGN